MRIMWKISIAAAAAQPTMWTPVVLPCQALQPLTTELRTLSCSDFRACKNCSTVCGKRLPRCAATKSSACLLQTLPLCIVSLNIPCEMIRASPDAYVSDLVSVRSRPRCVSSQKAKSRHNLQSKKSCRWGWTHKPPRRC